MGGAQYKLGSVRLLLLLYYSGIKIVVFLYVKLLRNPQLTNLPSELTSFLMTLWFPVCNLGRSSEMGLKSQKFENPLLAFKISESDQWGGNRGPRHPADSVLFYITGRGVMRLGSWVGSGILQHHNVLRSYESTFTADFFPNNYRYVEFSCDM